MFRQHNARPYTWKGTRQKLRELVWDVLMYPAYSPNLASSVYHLFLVMVMNYMAGAETVSRETCENRLSMRLFNNRLFFARQYVIDA